MERTLEEFKPQPYSFLASCSRHTQFRPFGLYTGQLLSNQVLDLPTLYNQLFGFTEKSQNNTMIPSKANGCF
jgi:hypothetical protein